MIEIILTQDRVTLVDDEDAEFANSRWIYERAGARLRSGKRSLMHREVMSRVLGRPLEKGEHVYHEDGNILNNTRSNLRVSSKNNGRIVLTPDEDSSEVVLTRGFVTLVSNCDLDLVRDRRWYARDLGTTTYAFTTGMLGMHRLIMNPGNMWVDHINGIGLDNRRCNLRLCSPSENMRNSRKKSGCTSVYKGVHLESSSGKWRSCIKVDGKILVIGSFENEQVAARAYDREALAHFGEFAKTNVDLYGSDYRLAPTREDKNGK